MSDDDTQRVAITLAVELAVDGIGLSEDLDYPLPTDSVDAHTVGQVFAHMLKDSRLWAEPYALVPEGEATLRTLTVLRVAPTYPCAVCGWKRACGHDGEECHT